MTTQEKLISLLKANPKISRKELSAKLGISQSNVQYHIEQLKAAGSLERIGAARGGYWKLHI